MSRTRRGGRRRGSLEEGKRKGEGSQKLAKSIIGGVKLGEGKIKEGNLKPKLAIATFI